MVRVKSVKCVAEYAICNLWKRKIWRRYDVTLLCAPTFKLLEQGTDSYNTIMWNYPTAHCAFCEIYNNKIGRENVVDGSDIGATEFKFLKLCLVFEKCTVVKFVCRLQNETKRYTVFALRTYNINITGMHSFWGIEGNLTFWRLLVRWCTNKFNIQQLHSLPKLCLCVLYLSEKRKATFAT
jgi:hypothetical protein